MQKNGTADLALLHRQVSALTSTPELALSKTDARHALATMWDFPSFDELTAQLAMGFKSSNGLAQLRPSDLLKTSDSLEGKAKAEVVARQIGRIINSMLDFPKLSERVGVVIPTLYGYSSMAEMITAETDVDPATIPIVSNDLIVQSRHSLLGPITGKRQGGVTLVSGATADQPVAFALDAAMKLGEGDVIRVAVSQTLAQALDFPTDKRWRLQNYQSLSGALSGIISHLHHESGTIFLLSMRGFKDAESLDGLIDELNSAVTIENGNRVLIDVGPIAGVTKKVWENTDHQILLQGSLDGYDGTQNALSLKDTDLSQISGFVSRAEKSFSFYLLRDRRDGYVISSLDQESPDDLNPVQACSA